MKPSFARKKPKKKTSHMNFVTSRIQKVNAEILFSCHLQRTIYSLPVVRRQLHVNLNSKHDYFTIAATAPEIPSVLSKSIIYGPTPECNVMQDLTFCMLGKNFSRRHLEIFFFIFPRKQYMTFHANCLQWRQFA